MMGGLGRGALLIVGLSFLSGCASFVKHAVERHEAKHICIAVKDKHELDRIIDESLFEAKHKNSDGLTRTMRRLERKRYKRKITPCD